MSLDIALAREAARVRASTRLRMPDAIQVAAVRLSGADAIVTNDHRWVRRVTQPALVLLDDYVDAECAAGAEGFIVGMGEDGKQCF